MKSIIEVGDIVIAADGQTEQHLFSGGGDRYECAVCVSVNPFILISDDGDMRWSSKKIEDFVSRGKAPSDVISICMNRLQRDISYGDVSGIVIGPIPTNVANLEKMNLC